MTVAALSGGQAVLFRAALAYAVLATRLPEQRILFLELAEAGDGETDRGILAACEAVADEVQVVVCTCVPTEAPAGWTVVDVGREAAHAV